MPRLLRPLASAALGLLLATATAWAADRLTPAAVIVFPPGVESIADIDIPALERLSAAAKSGEAKWISLESYADDQGSRELNLALAQRRIDQVTHQLAVLGFPANRIRGTSYGEERMDESEQPMRRVEIRIRRMRY